MSDTTGYRPHRGRAVDRCDLEADVVIAGYGVAGAAAAVEAARAGSQVLERTGGWGGAAAPGRAPRRTMLREYLAAVRSAPRVIALEGRPVPERLRAWAEVGVTDVLYGPPDDSEQTLVAYLGRLRGKLAATGLLDDATPAVAAPLTAEVHDNGTTPRRSSASRRGHRTTAAVSCRELWKFDTQCVNVAVFYALHVTWTGVRNQF